MSFIITQLARKASITNKHQELREGENLIMSPLVFQKIVTSTIYYVWATHFSNTTLDCQEIRSHVAFFFLTPPSNDAESLCRWIYHRELYADTLLVTQADICPFCLWSHLSVDYKRKTAPCCVSIRRATSLHLLDGNFWELVFVYARQNERRCVCVGVHKLMGGGVCMKRRDAMALGEQVFHRLLTLPGGVGSGRCDLFGEWRRGKRVQCSYYKRKRLDTYSSIVMSKAEMMQSHALSHTPPLWWAVQIGCRKPRVKRVCLCECIHVVKCMFTVGSHHPNATAKKVWDLSLLVVLQKLYFLGHFGPKYLRKLYAADFELKVANLGILVIIKVLFFCFFFFKRE